MESEEDPSRLTVLQHVQADRELERQLEARLRPYLNRINENIFRVSRLLRFFDEDLKQREGGEDILRAGVVFIHAYLEDFLRTLAEELLPAGDESSLKDIPLAGSGSFGRSEKFVLGQLAHHKGKTVDELLRQSVSEYLSRATFSSTTEIAALLTRLGFKVEDHNQTFGAIDEMIRRRHQIVHRADSVDESGTHILEKLEPVQVAEWLSATHTFVASLITPLMNRLPELMKAKRD
jgi:hypothetical protein